jgi:hypothetical protein
MMGGIARPNQRIVGSRALTLSGSIPRARRFSAHDRRALTMKPTSNSSPTTDKTHQTYGTIRGSRVTALARISELPVSDIEPRDFGAVEAEIEHEAAIGQNKSDDW